MPLVRRLTVATRGDYVNFRFFRNTIPSRQRKINGIGLLWEEIGRRGGTMEILRVAFLSDGRSLNTKGDDLYSFFSNLRILSYHVN
jgi:hypothetical protein